MLQEMMAAFFTHYRETHFRSARMRLLPVIDGNVVMGLLPLFGRL
jgi:hypothetical protein